MTHSAHTAAIEYEAETNHGENVHTFGTLRLPLAEMPKLALVHEKIDSGRVQQHRQGGSQWIVGTHAGSKITTKHWLTGHGSATSGAVSLTTLETLFGLVLGNATSTGTGTTFTGAGTATAPGTTSANGLAAGGLIRAGALNDGLGHGQFGVIGTHTTSVATLLTALPGIPANTNVLHSAVNIYPSESPTSTAVTPIRMRFLSANLRYELHGCVPTAIVFSTFETGAKPFIEITWEVSWWEGISSGTFPSTLATFAANPAAIAAGSVFLNAVGTATRAVVSVRSFTVEYTLGIELFRGPGGFSPYQEVVQARRTRDSIKVTLLADADANTASPVFTGHGLAGTSLHLLYSMSCVPFTALAMYFPNLCVTNIATQEIDQNTNRMRLEAMAYTGSDTTSELSMSAMRMAFA